METYDVFVIGSGIAGQTAAKICRSNGLKTAICDNREFGGVCANRGCDPKKVLIQFSDLLNTTKNLKSLGVDKLPEINWKAVQKLKSKFTAKVPKSTEENLLNLEIDIYHQSPEFIDDHTVMVEGKKISATYFVIASGRTPRTLKIKGQKHLKLSDDILNLKKIPKSATFIGSGYVGMEFACMLQQLGTKVTILEHGPQALKHFDSFLVNHLIEKMKSDGVNFIFNAEVNRIERLTKNHRINYTINGKHKTIKTRKVFNTAGRVPSTEQLKLKNAGIEETKEGVLVNEFMQSVSKPNFYACGDVSSASLPLTPLSGLQGYVAAHNILKENSKKFTYPLVPSTVFTSPNLSSVGMSEEEATSRYKTIKVYKGDATHWYNAKKENAKIYAYKIITNERTDEIVGAHILSHQSNECINILRMAITQKMTTKQFKKQIFTYPSYTNDLRAMLKNED